MPQYVNRDKALEILKEIRAKREKKIGCQKSAGYEITGIDYAVAVLNRLETIEVAEDDTQQNTGPVL